MSKEEKRECELCGEPRKLKDYYKNRKICRFCVIDSCSLSNKILRRKLRKEDMRKEIVMWNGMDGIYC